MSKTIPLITSILFLGLGCAQGNCRSQTSAAKDMNGTLSKNTPPASSNERVMVYKYDGSLQCGQGKALSINEMAKDLKGVQVYSSTNKADGLMHIAQCGSPTGKANVFEIDRKDLVLAQKAGFKEWLWE